LQKAKRPATATHNEVRFRGSYVDFLTGTMVAGYSDVAERLAALTDSHAPGSASPPQLLDRVRTAVRVRHYSRRTEQAYVEWIRRFILFHKKRHPSTMGPAEVSAFLAWLAVERRVSASTQTQALSALLFLYRAGLAIEIAAIPPVVRARTPERLPVVLSREEIGAILKQVTGTERLIVMVLYGSGVRLEECLDLRVKDLDFDRHQIIVRQGKGQRDRATMLPTAAREGLTRYLADVRRLHERDLACGFGHVVLPFALDRKFPNAATEWRWQFVFPAARMCRATIRAAVPVSFA
jgi:integron integrase